MKSLTELWTACIYECAQFSGVNATQDVKTALRRVEDEGLSFLTITLPKFGSDLETGLDRGFVDSDLFVGFAYSGGLPRFLSGFLRQIFDASTGILLPSPCVEAIRSLRQICYLLKKVELPCTPEREKAAEERYLRTEMELRDREDSCEWTDVDYVEFSRMASLVLGDSLAELDRLVWLGEILPKHGPGLVSDGLKGNQKWNLPIWTDRLDEIFPYVDFGLPNHRYWADRVPVHLSPDQEPPVKVVFVPKTLSAPRVIAIEPTHMQYMQQGLLNALVDVLESRDHGTPFIGFTDQLPNQELAREGSISQSLATLDLSDASDRVLNSLVMHGLVRNFPWLRKALDATRSRCSLLPSGDVIELRKFASMGSAVCFPVEAMVFTTIVFLGIERSLGRALSRKDILSFAGMVRIYGDDIVIPVQHTASVVEQLTRFGLLVNHRKSFWTGKFRESCGGDFFDGEWVTPIRCTSKNPTSWTHVVEAQAWTAMSNNLHKAGYWKTAAYAAGMVEQVYGKLAVVPETSRAMGLHSFCGVDESSHSGWDVDLHVPLIKAHIVQAETPPSQGDELGSLLKCLRFDWSDPVDSLHLQQAGRPRPRDRKIRKAKVSAV